MTTDKSKIPTYVTRRVEPANLRGFRTVKEEAARLGLRRQSIYHRLRTGRYYEAVQFGDRVMLRAFDVKGPVVRRGRRPVEV